MYEIPIISADLRHEEAIVQTGIALEMLQEIMDSVFSKINARAEMNIQKINSIKERINNANEKVFKLIGSKKSIKIYSPSKFPSSEIFEDIPVTFGTTTKNEVKSFEERLLSIEISSHTENPEKYTQEKLHLFQVKLHKEIPIISREGLGRLIPSHTKFVGSLLLFGGNKNIYEQSGPMEIVASKKIAKSTELAASGNTDRELEAAPNSITNRQYNSDKNQRQHNGIFYSPGVAEAPKMELPFDLPDLPGVAGDVQFGIMENLSKIDDSDDEITLPPVPLSVHSEIAKIPLPPPPPPPISTVTYSLIPPPPPPPSQPPKLEGVQSTNNQDEEKHETTSVVSGTAKKIEVPDARSNLMAAIRNAGGQLKLRAAADLERKEAPRKLKEDKAMDLMTDLHNKLMMRRKGISGEKKDEPRTVKDRLSSLIPTPTKKSSDDERSEDEWTE